MNQSFANIPKLFPVLHALNMAGGQGAFHSNKREIFE
jgi:hypothetical protein